jgi:hypothetical protein
MTGSRQVVLADDRALGIEDAYVAPHLGPAHVAYDEMWRQGSSEGDEVGR